MDHPFALIRRVAAAIWFAGLALWLCSGQAFAFGTVAGTTGGTSTWWYVQGFYAGVQYTSAANSAKLGACDDFLAKVTAGNTVSGRTFTNASSDQTACYINTYLNGTYQTYNAYAYTSTTHQDAGGCPTNASMEGTTCVCNLGYKSQSGACVSQGNCPAAGGWSSQTQPDMQVPNGSTLDVCIGGCQARAHSNTRDPSGTFWAQWPFVYSGPAAYCGGGTGSSPNPPDHDDTDGNTGDPAPGHCDTGYYYGTVNGTTGCFGGPGNVANGDPGLQTTTGTNTTNPDGSTSTTTTTCQGDHCTSTTTTRNSGGTVTGTTTTSGSSNQQSPGGSGGRGAGDQQQQDFCALHPNLPVCKVSSWGGSCGAFTCDGDAVQCSIAREQHVRNCQTLENAPSDHPAVVAANGQAHPADHPYTTGTSSSLSFATGIDQTELVSGSCPADRSMTFLGGSYTLKLSQLCTPLGWLGNIAVALTMLVCMFIVFGKRE